MKNRTLIKNPLLELEEILPALVPIIEESINARKKELIVKVYVKNSPVEELSSFDKDIALLYYCLHPFVSKISNKIDLSVFRVKITDTEAEIFYKENEDFKSFYFTLEDVIKQSRELNDMTDKQKEDFYINRLITILSKK